MHWGDMGSWGWAGALIGLIFMLVVVGLLVAVIVAALRGSEPRGGPAPRGGPTQSTGGAEQVLAERFARGEIDEDEFNQRRRTLRGG